MSLKKIRVTFRRAKVATSFFGLYRYRLFLVDFIGLWGLLGYTGFDWVALTVFYFTGYDRVSLVYIGFRWITSFYWLSLSAQRVQVSWVRKKEGDLLSVDSDTFVGDSRFQVIHPAHSNTWTLHLRGVRGSDDGEYECQVSSEPKMSLLYKLNVVGKSLSVSTCTRRR